MRNAELAASLLIAVSLAHTDPVDAQTSRQDGRIAGVVLDADTQTPLPGATVLLEGSQSGTATDREGRFTFDDLTSADYAVVVTFVGFEAVRRPDVIVRQGRTSYVEIMLHPAVLTGDEAVVTAAAYTNADRSVSGLVRLNAEEIRRAPGSAGDVARVLSSLPSVAKVNDMRNGLIVRGGSPGESATFIDGIFVPNLNHFPTQGSSDGAISLLNVDLIRNVSFVPGGFSATYGDRLSSITEIDLRNGNSEGFEGQLDLNLAGAGFITEGGLGDRKGSWIVSARRSYLDFLVNNLLGDEVDAVPVYSDIQAKASLDATSNDRFDVLSIVGLDQSGISRESAIDENENTFGDADFTAVTVGAGWRRLLSGNGFSNTTASYSRVITKIDFRATISGETSFLNRSDEHNFRAKNVTHLRLGSNRLEFGAEANYLSGDYDQLYGASTDPLGTLVPETTINDRLCGLKGAAFATIGWYPVGNLSLSPGIRLDYFSYTRELTVSPRFSTAYHMTAGTTLRAAGGLFTQQLPGILLAMSEKNQSLPSMRSIHATVGVSQLLSENTLLTVDVYWKSYRNMPLDQNQPGLFTIDEVYYNPQPLALYSYHENLVSDGEARTIGLEVLLQKKIVDGMYGQVGGSYFRSEYLWPGDDWRPRAFDNRFLFSAEGGYKIDEKNEFSLKWTYAGGAPTTPFDEGQSTEARSGIFDESRINGVRLPPYHSWSLRYDRRFHFSGSTLVAYLDIWNVYGRRNISGYFWNEIEASVQEVLQFGMLPVVGLEFEF